MPKSRRAPLGPPAITHSQPWPPCPCPPPAPANRPPGSHQPCSLSPWGPPHLSTKLPVPPGAGGAEGAAPSSWLLRCPHPSQLWPHPPHAHTAAGPQLCTPQCPHADTLTHACVHTRTCLLQTHTLCAHILHVHTACTRTRTRMHTQAPFPPSCLPSRQNLREPPPPPRAQDHLVFSKGLPSGVPSPSLH